MNNEDILKNLDGYETGYKGNPKNKPTKKQKEIIKYIKEETGITPYGKMTSETAWEFIKENYPKAREEI